MDVQDLVRKLRNDRASKIVLVVADGLGGLPQERGGPTELEAADTSNLDRLAAEGVCGLLIPVLPGITSGSGPGHLGLFGYDPLKYVIGRGVLPSRHGRPVRRSALPAGRIGTTQGEVPDAAGDGPRPKTREVWSLKPGEPIGDAAGRDRCKRSKHREMAGNERKMPSHYYPGIGCSGPSIALHTRCLAIPTRAPPSK